MNAGALAPQVAQFTRHLSELGHSRLTVSGYEAAARHVAQWLALTKVSRLSRSMTPSLIGSDGIAVAVPAFAE
jgi:hypothetical protein